MSHIYVTPVETHVEVKTCGTNYLFRIRSKLFSEMWKYICRRMRRDRRIRWGDTKGR